MHLQRFYYINLIILEFESYITFKYSISLLFLLLLLLLFKACVLYFVCCFRQNVLYHNFVNSVLKLYWNHNNFKIILES